MFGKTKGTLANIERLQEQRKGVLNVFETMKNTLASTNDAMIVEQENLNKEIEDMKEISKGLTNDMSSNDTIINNINLFFGHPGKE